MTPPAPAPPRTWPVRTTTPCRAGLKPAPRTVCPAPSPEVCAQTGTGPANPVQSQPFHSTEVQEAHYYDGLHQRLHDPDLFQNNAPGDYQYVQTTYGKFAEGTLGNEPGKRNLSDQRTVGGADRRPTDDGGHLICCAC